MANWIIYGSNNVAKAIVKELELHDEWMAECYITVSVKSATPISFAVGDYIDYRGERYTIQYDPNVIKKATSGSYGEGFTYDNIKFVGLQDEVVRCDFNDIVLNDNDIHYTALPTFPFYCESVDDLLDRIQANLEDLYPGQWIVIGLNTVRNSQRGTAVGRAQAFVNAYKQYVDPTGAAHTDPYGKQGVAETADNITCWDAMKKVHDDFDLNFIVRGRVIIVGTAGVFTANTFRYGKGNGLYEIERIGESDQRIVTRLRAYGSEENLPAHYYNTVNKQVYATVNEVKGKFGNYGCSLVLDLDFDKKYFSYRDETTPGDSNNPNYIVKVKANDVTIKARVCPYLQTGKTNVYCYYDGTDEDFHEPDASKMAAFVEAISANDRIDFVDYVNKDAFGEGHYDYATGHLPDNMAVSRLMLPGFPTMSLHAWVQAHKNDADKTWLAQAIADGFTFSTEIYRPYIDSPNKNQYGVRPGSIYFDGSDETENIHPTIEGMTHNNAPIDEIYAADQVDDNGVYPAGEEVKNIKIYLPDLGFDLKSVFEEGASIDMKNGMCGARSFKIAGVPKQDINNRWECSVERVHDEALDLWFPYCDFQIHGSSEAGYDHGDKYVLTGIDMPDAYIDAAAVKLLQYSIEALKKNHAPRYTYQPRIDELWMQRQHDTASASQGGVSLHDTLKAGDIFAFADTDLDIDSSIIIDVLTIKENGNNGLPTYEVTLRDEKQVGTIQKITNKVDSIISGATSINGATGGGLSVRQIQSLINNYGGEKFLSKLDDDTAQGFITMLKGLQVGANFVPDILGEGGVLRMRQDGKVELVTDILYARVKAYFDSVEIREYQHTGGNRIASVAGNKICRVAWFNSSNVELEQTQANLASVAYFRCYFRASDGEDTVRNNWVVGDQAYCHITSIVNSSDNPEQKGLNQKHLWRLVIGRNTEGTLTEDGEAYIDISNRATETISGNSYTGYQSGSDIPEAQDDIIQLGNVNDTTRQGAIVEFVTGTDAPSYQIYQGINSFSLNNKNQIGFGYNTSTGRAYMNVYGDFRFGARPNTQGSYLEYNSQTGTLNIKAHVEFTNTDQELDTLVQNHQRDDSYDDTEVRGLISGLQEQIDGQIETWFYNYSPVNVDASGAPTSNVPLNVAPYSDWTTDNDKIAHLGDTFTNNSTGYCWRFSRNSSTNAFEWVIIEDSAVITALQNAARAQDTADHKRRVFICDSSHQTPTPPYDAGDLWVNVKYPWATGATYNDEILKCVTSKTSGSFAIADWSLANGYTAKLNNFVNNTYSPFAQNIQTQVDKKAETWRQATNPATSWTTEAEKAKHVGDLWMDTANGKKTYIYQNTAAAGATPVYDWVAQDVPDEVFDKIDGKAAIYVGWRDWIVGDVSQLKDKDLYIPNTDHNPYKANKVYRWRASDSTWNEISYTDDTAFNNYINAFLNGTGASGDSATAAAIQKAIAGALGSGTIVDGGLLLTSLIGMRKNIGTTESPVYETWAGISGQYDDWSGSTHAKGHGIAAWYGGAMVDKEDVQTLPASYAKSLFRFDGSGYLASGNITWNENGSLTIKNITTLSDSNNNNILNELATFNSAFTFGTSGQGSTTALYITPNVPFESLYIGTSNANKKEVATREWVGNNYVSTAFFRQLFRAFKPNATAGQGDVEVQPNTIDATISNIKAMVGFWTEQYVSALGNSSDSGGGGGGASVLYGLNDVSPNATGDGVLGAQDGYVLTYNGSTNHWYAAPTSETYILPQATANALGGIKIGYAASGKNYAIVLDTNGKAYVNVPWTDTTYTLAGLMGSTAIGGATQPIYWNGSAFANTTYTLAKSVPADAKFTDTTYSFSNADATLAWSTRTKIATTGGTDIYVTLPANPNTDTWRNIFLDGTEKLTTGINTKGLNFVGDGKTTISFLAAGTGSGQSGSANYATIKISSTWRGIQNNLTSDSTTDSLSAAQGKALKGSITTLEGYFDNGVANDAAKLNGQSADYYATADDLSTVQGYFDANGNANAALKLTTVSKTAWGQTYWTANGVPTTISGNMTNVGNISFSATGKNIGSIAYFDTTNSRLGIGTSSPSYKLHVNGTFYASGNSSIGGTFGVTGATTLTGLLTANGGIAIASSKTLKIGDIYLAYDSTNNAIEVYKLDGTNHVAANLYARGGIAALGETSDGGGGGGQGDVTWALLASDSDTRQIALSHLTTALSGYSTTSHTHTTTIATSTGISQISLTHGGKFSITAGGTSYIFTMPSAYSLPTAAANTLGGIKVGTTLSISNSVLNLPTTGVTAGTYKCVTVDAYGRVTSGDNTDTDTWRNIYVAGTEKLTTAITTKGLNFAAGTNVTINFAAAGTGSGQSGNANYGTLTINATDTTYSAATQSADGLMSAADKIKLDGIAANANNYSLPLAASGTRGGVQIGYTTNATNRNYAVQLSSEKAYVNVPWTDTTYSNGTGLSLSNGVFSLSSTYQNYVSHGESAYNSLSNYLPLSGGTMTGHLTINALSIGANDANLNINDTTTNRDYIRVITYTASNLGVGGEPNIYIGQANSIYNGGYIGFKYNGSGSTSNFIGIGLYSVDNILVVDGNARCGIGTTSPTQKLEVNGNVLASSFIKSGGTSSQFLKADGSVDSNTYATTSSLSSYLPLSAGTGNTLTGSLFIGTGTTEYVRFYTYDKTRLAGYLAWTENTYGKYVELYEPITDRGIWIGDMNTNAPIYWNGSTMTQYAIWHTGNFSPSDYLPLTGGTLTGRLNVNCAADETYGCQTITMTQSSTSGWPRWMTFSAPNVSAGVNLNLTFGKDVSNERNSGNIGFHYTGNGSTSNYLFLGLHSVDYKIVINGNGYVGINTTSPSYQLHVSGDVYATGGVTCLSDIRKKDVVSYNLSLNVTQIANAPTIKFLWKDKREEGEQIGTIAQYWQKVLPWVVKDKSNELSMQYGVAALVAAITTARKVVDHEARIKALERENKELKEEISRLKIA